MHNIFKTTVTARRVIQTVIKNYSTESADPFERMIFEIYGPVLTTYTWWVLVQARAKKIKDLYFLARDGYILFQIAKKICDKYSLDFNCRYLYCSRVSLRLPTYCILGEDSLDSLMQKYHSTTRLELLKRLSLTEEELTALVTELQIPNHLLDTPMTNSSYEKFIIQLKKNNAFKGMLKVKSQNAISTLETYLRQEGLFNCSSLAVVDCGWAGTMQRSISKILIHCGGTSSITGFYFGLFSWINDDSVGEYYSWYFREGLRNIARKARFSDSLFECMCTAPHGMTIGYKEVNSTVFPIFHSPEAVPDWSKAQSQIDIILKFVTMFLEQQICFDAFSKPSLLRMNKRILRRFMYNPSTAITKQLEELVFSEDMMEWKCETLIEPMTLTDIKPFSFGFRIQKLLYKDQNDSHPKRFYWIYGSLNNSNLSCKAWYRKKILIARYIYYIKLGLKQRKR